MISENRIIFEILKSIPEFLPIIQRAKEEWGANDKFPIGLQLEEFTSFLFEKLKDNENKKNNEIITRSCSLFILWHCTLELSYPLG